MGHPGSIWAVQWNLSALCALESSEQSGWLRWLLRRAVCAWQAKPSTNQTKRLATASLVMLSSIT